MSASYWDISLYRDINGKLTTQLYDKRDYITFFIVNFPYLFSNKPLSPAYVVYISHNSFDALDDQFLSQGKLLTNTCKLLLQGFQQSRFKAAFRKFYGRHNDLVCPYNLSLSQ